MKFGVLGTGMVGNAIGSKLIALGHEVKMGSRSNESEKAIDWVIANGNKASNGTFEDAAKYGDMIFICTAGTGTMEALRIAKAENFTGKIVIDVTNPLDYSQGMPPTLFVSGNDSLGEQVHNYLEDSFVVKTLNIVNNAVMVNPEMIPGEPDMFVCGDHDKAKQEVTKILRDFGWKSIIDLGGIEQCRAMEPFILLWVQAWKSFQTPMFALKFLRNEQPKA